MTDFGGTGYNPVHLPGHAVTLTALTAVSARDLLAVAGSGLVTPVTAAGQQWVGVAAFPAQPGETVAVYGRGPVHEHLAGGPVTAGDLLMTAAAAGQVTAAADDTDRAAVCGIALTSAADAVPVRWMAI